MIHSNLQVVMNNRVNAYQRPHNKEEDGDKDMTVDECVLKGSGFYFIETNRSYSEYIIGVFT